MLRLTLSKRLTSSDTRFILAVVAGVVLAFYFHAVCVMLVG